MSEYAHPEVLVSTDWVKENLGKDGIKIVEIDVDTQQYDVGHVPGAIGLNWETQLQNQVRRDIASKEEFEQMMRDVGISNDDTVILYGDNNNWFAAYGFWLFKLYGHKDVRLMNGGRNKWLNEDDKELVAERPSYAASNYTVSEVNNDLRALLPKVFEAQQGGHNLVDVRSPDEYTGKVIAPPGMSETAQRGGHIPGAANIPWSTTVQGDGTFKSLGDLKELYGSKGVDFAKPTIAYCRIGERSSHTWFVLKYLLGVKDVRNYDGSWTEYGNLIGAGIEK